MYGNTSTYNFGMGCNEMLMDVDAVANNVIGVPRNTQREVFLELLRKNVNDLAYHLAPVLAYKPDALDSTWHSLGGDIKEFKDAVIEGARKRPGDIVELATIAAEGIGANPPEIKWTYRGGDGNYRLVNMDTINELLAGNPSWKDKTYLWWTPALAASPGSLTTEAIFMPPTFTYQGGSGAVTVDVNTVNELLKGNPSWRDKKFVSIFKPIPNPLPDPYYFYQSDAGQMIVDQEDINALLEANPSWKDKFNQVFKKFPTNAKRIGFFKKLAPIISAAIAIASVVIPAAGAVAALVPGLNNIIGAGLKDATKGLNQTQQVASMILPKGSPSPQQLQTELMYQLPPRDTSFFPSNASLPTNDFSYYSRTPTPPSFSQSPQVTGSSFFSAGGFIFKSILLLNLYQHLFTPALVSILFTIIILSPIFYFLIKKSKLWQEQLLPLTLKRWRGLKVKF